MSIKIDQLLWLSSRAAQWLATRGRTRKSIGWRSSASTMSTTTRRPTWTPVSKRQRHRESTASLTMQVSLGCANAFNGWLCKLLGWRRFRFNCLQASERSRTHLPMWNGQYLQRSGSSQKCQKRLRLKKFSFILHSFGLVEDFRWLFIVKRAKLQGFMVFDHIPEWPMGMQQVGEWLKEVSVDVNSLTRLDKKVILVEGKAEVSGDGIQRLWTAATSTYRPTEWEESWKSGRPRLRIPICQFCALEFVFCKVHRYTHCFSFGGRVLQLGTVVHLRLYADQPMFRDVIGNGYRLLLTVAWHGQSVVRGLTLDRPHPVYPLSPFAVPSAHVVAL